jgi:nitrite reductase/ring-hydroxylating ferredoxin subunit
MSDLDRFNDAVEAVISDHSPRELLDDMSPEEQRMVAMAQLLRGTREDTPSPLFREQLRARIAAEPRKIPRRTALLSTLGALAAGIVAGFGLDRAFRRGGGSGWVDVAHADTLREGVPHPFKVGKTEGFVIKQDGEVRAISRICTDVGCALNFSRSTGMLVCPCHGAEFNLRGRNVVGLGAGPYSSELPPLPHIKVQQRGGSVQVWDD